MASWKCSVCGYVFDEQTEGKTFDSAGESYRCPVCNSPKSAFQKVSEASGAAGRASQKTVSDVIVDNLSAWGVEHVFGLPGTSCLGVVEALRKNPRMSFIVVRHEEVAALAASAYAKLTGKPGACLTIAGPGATNLVTGLYDAKMDSAPVIAITGQVKRAYIGPGTFQEIDQEALFDPICVFNKTVYSRDQAPSLSALALKHAIVQGGVSHLGIPNDVQKEPLPGPVIPMQGMLAPSEIPCRDEDVAKAAALAARAERPVIIAGWGARGLGNELLALSKKIGAPIATTFRGKGIVSERLPECLGVLGGIGTNVSRPAVDEADLIIAVGTSFADKTEIPLGGEIIQVDTDPMKIAKTYPITLGVRASASCFVRKLLAAAGQKPGGFLEKHSAEKKKWDAQLAAEADAKAKPVRPPLVMRALQELAADDAIITVDTGDDTFWFSRNFQASGNQTILSSGYLATMGFGLPAALAAKIAAPDRQVVCVVGDGGFSQVMADFATAVKYNLPIAVVLLNNSELAMISMEQRMEGYPKFATELNNPDFAAFAQSCGGSGTRVAEPAGVRGALEKALASKVPALVEIAVDAKRF